MLNHIQTSMNVLFMLLNMVGRVIICYYMSGFYPLLFHCLLLYVRVLPPEMSFFIITCQGFTPCHVIFYYYMSGIYPL